MSFQQGLSGINASARNLDVIGHNIANVNTVGAKGSRAEFADMYANTMNRSGGGNIGIGVRVAAVAQQFNQGDISSTENPLDMAINGSGFFQVGNGHDAPLYTRNGQFKADREGYIVNNDGLKLLGYQADPNGLILPSKAMPLQLPTQGINPRQTSKIGVEVNLDARLTAPGGTFDPDDPTTYNSATSLTVYDIKGQDVALALYFRKTGTGQWDVFGTANGVPVNMDPGPPAAPSMQITFPPDGRAPTAPTAPFAITIPATGGGQTFAIAGVQIDMTKMTEYGAPFAVTDLPQDGNTAGQLTDVSIDDKGVITARYSNGQTKPAGQIEIANFRNPQALQPMGGNAWGATFAAGTPVAGVPGTGALGVLQTKALEESNVDVTHELVNMITAQRAFQANAQTIKTQDQVLQTVVNLR